LATIFSLYLLGIHLVLYSGLLHFIPASLPCPLSVSHFLPHPASLPCCALAPFARMAYWDWEKEKRLFRFSVEFVKIECGSEYFFFLEIICIIVKHIAMIKKLISFFFILLTYIVKVVYLFDLFLNLQILLLFISL